MEEFSCGGVKLWRSEVVEDWRSGEVEEWKRG